MRLSCWRSGGHFYFGLEGTLSLWCNSVQIGIDTVLAIMVLSYTQLKVY